MSERRLLAVEIESRSPVLLQEAPASGNLLETLPFVPGNALRGMFARRYLEHGGAASDSRFKMLFLNGATRFGFGYLNGALVLPHSARSCKYEGDFHANEGHGVVDLVLAPRDEETRCPECGRGLDYIEGFYEPANPARVRVRTRLLTRTAISVALGTAAMGRLYSQRVIEQGQSFIAEVDLPVDLADPFRKLIGAGFEATLGSGASRGQGWVSVRETKPKTFPWGSAAERYRRVLQASAGQPLLVVTLLSDAFFSDEYLRDLSAPRASHLAPLGIDAGAWQERPARAWADTRLVFGFDGAPIGLPRTVRLAVQAGSSFVFEPRSVDTPPAAPPGDGIGWIGEQRREGYGRAALWHPFHVEPDREVKHVPRG